MRTKLAMVVLSGFVLVAAASCGGSDGLSTAEEEALQERLEAAELEAAEAARQAAEAARQAAEAAREAAEAERLRQEEEAARQKAEEEAAEAERLRQAEQEAREEAERLRLEEEAARAEAERLRREEEAARAEAERLRQEEEAARQAAEQARQQAQQEQERLQGELTEAQREALKARANLFSVQLATPEERTDVTPDWPRNGRLTFTPGGNFSPSSSAPGVPGGWRSAGFTAESGTAGALVNETVYLYTNIQAPSTRAFWKEFGLNEPMTTTLDDFARGSSGQAKTETPTGTTTTNVTEITVRGSFAGAGGTFTCSTCTATDLGSGVLATRDQINAHIASHVTFDQGEPTFQAPTSWTFKPDSINSVVTRDAAGATLDEDDAYLYFGSWSSIPDVISATTGYDFEYISGGGAEAGGDLTNFGDLAGAATFRGGAVGMYTTQGQVGGANAKIGTFTATATLQADFTANTLGGRITDFREDGSDLAGWRVTLGLADDVSRGAPIAAAAVATQTNGTLANIGGLSIGGNWGATFHGSNNPGYSELTDKTMYPATGYPPVDLAGVTGWFSAARADPNDVAIAGVFGATPSN